MSKDTSGRSKLNLGREAMTTEAERDCKHGQLARSCNVCELEAEVERQAAEIERLKQKMFEDSDAAVSVVMLKYPKALAERDKANSLLRQALEALAKYTTPRVLGGRVPIDAELVAAIKQHLGEDHGN